MSAVWSNPHCTVAPLRLMSFVAIVLVMLGFSYCGAPAEESVPQTEIREDAPEMPDVLFEAFLKISEDITNSVDSIEKAGQPSTKETLAELRVEFEESDRKAALVLNDFDAWLKGTSPERRTKLRKNLLDARNHYLQQLAAIAAYHNERQARLALELSREVLEQVNEYIQAEERRRVEEQARNNSNSRGLRKESGSPGRTAPAGQDSSRPSPSAQVPTNATAGDCSGCVNTTQFQVLLANERTASYQADSHRQMARAYEWAAEQYRSCGCHDMARQMLSLAQYEKQLAAQFVDGGDGFDGF